MVQRLVPEALSRLLALPLDFQLEMTWPPLTTGLSPELVERWYHFQSRHFQSSVETEGPPWRLAGGWLATSRLAPSYQLAKQNTLI